MRWCIRSKSYARTFVGEPSVPLTSNSAERSFTASTWIRGSPNPATASDGVRPFAARAMGACQASRPCRDQGARQVSRITVAAIVAWFAQRKVPPDYEAHAQGREAWQAPPSSPGAVAPGVTATRHSQPVTSSLIVAARDFEDGEMPFGEWARRPIRIRPSHAGVHRLSGHPMQSARP